MVQWPLGGHGDGDGDDELELIFARCHPALDPEVRVPLTFRSVCGLGTAEIAAAFVVAEATMAQRIVRAKRKVRPGEPEVTGLARWPQLHIARAGLLHRLGRGSDALAEYGAALAFGVPAVEQEFIARRMAEIEAP